MPKLRRLSGPDVVAILARFGFQPLTQRGSHIKLCLVRPDGTLPIIEVSLAGYNWSQTRKRAFKRC